jgi:nucleoid DNA-binding protein
LKLVENLIKECATEFEISEMEAHQAIMYQFEYVNKAAKTSELLIELSGIGYFQVNPKKLRKEVQDQKGIINSLGIRLKKEEGDKAHSTQTKIEDMQRQLDINLLKLHEQDKKDLEKSKKYTKRNME